MNFWSSSSAGTGRQMCEVLQKTDPNEKPAWPVESMQGTIEYLFKNLVIIGNMTFWL